MSTVDVTGCIAAIVATFQTGVELIEQGKEARDKKKKGRKKDKNVEVVVQEKMLLSVLKEGAKQIDEAAQYKRQRFGYAFERGDSIATSKLKDIMISLQGELVRALQIARQNEAAILSYTKLYELTLNSRFETTRSMDDLCQRIVAGTTLQGPIELEASSRERFELESPSHVVSPLQSPSEMSESDRADSVLLPPTIRLPGHEEPMPQGHTRAGGTPTYASPIASPLERLTSKVSRTPSFKWMASRSKRDSADILSLQSFSKHRRSSSVVESSVPHRVASVSTSKGDRSDSPTPQSQTPSPQLSFTPSPSRGFDHSSSITSSKTSYDMPISGSPGPGFRSHGRKDSARSTPAPPVQADSARTSFYQTEGSSIYSMLVDGDGGPSMADFAPELVTNETGAMLDSGLQRPSSSIRQTVPSSVLHPHNLPEFSIIAPPVLASIAQDHWAPLERPAQFNNYHGFCKGAWATRRGMQEGLSIKMLPSRSRNNNDDNDEQRVIPHWQCKDCNFRSKATNDSKSLPAQIYLASCGIRYRWLFLAKSHTVTQNSHMQPEDYAYGCIFCAAQGRQTGTHRNLDVLMSHILSKHKVAMMTPEVLGNTKCIVGRVAGKDEDWDINIYESRNKSRGAGVGGLLITAVTGVGTNSYVKWQ